MAMTFTITLWYIILFAVITDFLQTAEGAAILVMACVFILIVTAIGECSTSRRINHIQIDFIGLSIYWWNVVQSYRQRLLTKLPK